MYRSVLLLVFLGCTTAGHTPYTTPLELTAIDVPGGRIYRYPPGIKEAVAPVPYGDWFLSSQWMQELAAKWADLPGAFTSEGPEYCSSIDVDANRMVHARMPVRAIRDVDSRTGCPPLAGSPGNKTLGSAHNHQVLQSKGERISSDDAALGSPFLLADTLQIACIAVDFDAPGDYLQGINPATGQPAPVPSQSS